MRTEVYQILDSDNKFLYNVAVHGDITSLFRYTKENKLKYKYIECFLLDENSLDRINDDLSIVKQEILL